MDNTVFLDQSKVWLQDSISLANEFYNFNNIYINSPKCELIVINLFLPSDQRFIMIGQDQVIIMVTNKEVHYLGIWIVNKTHQKLWIQRLGSIVQEFLLTIGNKTLGIGYIAYLINKVLIPKLTYVA